MYIIMKTLKYRSKKLREPQEGQTPNSIHPDTSQSHCIKKKNIRNKGKDYRKITLRNYESQNTMT